MYGDVVLVPINVHFVPPSREYKKTTEATPEPTSDALAVTVYVFVFIYALVSGAVSVTVGGAISTVAAPNSLLAVGIELGMDVQVFVEGS